MESKQSNFIAVLMWLIPSGVELAVYIFITFFTVILCSQEFVSSLFFVSGDFNPIRSGIASIDELLQNLVGEKVAGSLSLGIFWGIIGLIVNLLWWLGSNFSTELNNDLVFSKYVHPKDIDPKSQLREFIEKTVIRTVVAVIALVYTNYFISQGLPRIAAKYAETFKDWSYTGNWQSLLITALSEILMLHIFVILARVILLRKKVFDN